MGLLSVIISLLSVIFVKHPKGIIFMAVIPDSERLGRWGVCSWIAWTRQAWTACGVREYDPIQGIRIKYLLRSRYCEKC